MIFTWTCSSDISDTEIAPKVRYFLVCCCCQVMDFQSPPFQYKHDNEDNLHINIQTSRHPGFLNCLSRHCPGGKYSCSRRRFISFCKYDGTWLCKIAVTSINMFAVQIYGNLRFIEIVLNFAIPWVKLSYNRNLICCLTYEHARHFFRKIKRKTSFSPCQLRRHIIIIIIIIYHKRHIISKAENEQPQK